MTRVVEFGPNTTWSGRAPRSPPTVARARSTTSSQALLAANPPPRLLAAGGRRKLAMAAIEVSTASVPPAPSRRAQPSASPGKRCLRLMGRSWRGSEEQPAPGVEHHRLVAVGRPAAAHHLGDPGDRVAQPQQQVD